MRRDNSLDCMGLGDVFVVYLWVFFFSGDGVPGGYERFVTFSYKKVLVLSPKNILSSRLYAPQYLSTMPLSASKLGVEIT